MSSMFASYIYLTRKCPRKCTYCTLRDSLKTKELESSAWKDVFEIIQNLNVDVLFTGGNESLLFGNDLKYMFKDVKIPYVVLTSLPSKLFNKYKNLYIPDEDGFFINNFSVAVDFSLESFKGKSSLTELEKKALDGWMGLFWAYDNSPAERWGCITASNRNKHSLLDMVKKLVELETYIDINLVHYAKDSSYDYFPPKEIMREYVFETDEDKIFLLNELKRIIHYVENDKKAAEFLKDHRIAYYKAIIDDPDLFFNYKYHCGGDPLGGPSVDADGSLRCCAYRPGKRTSKLSIFDLPKKLDEWKENVYLDTMDCLGCSWEGTWMYHYSKMLSYSPYAKTIEDTHFMIDFDKEIHQKRG